MTKSVCTHQHTGSCSPDGVYLYVRCMDCWNLLSVSDEGRRRMDSCPGYEPPKKQIGRACIHCGFDFHDHIVVLCCDLCGATENEPFHYTGILDGKLNKHIHICESCEKKHQPHKNDFDAIRAGDSNSVFFSKGKQ